MQNEVIIAYYNAEIFIVGQNVGNYYFKKEVDRKDRPRRRAIFECKCGYSFESDINKAKIRALCPICYPLDKKGNRRPGNINNRNQKSHTSEYGIWIGIKTRCYNVKHNTYKNYGLKGIRMCDKWKNSFDAFISDMGGRPSKSHSLDRYPNKNGNYEPSNCRWATSSQQMNNRSNTLLLKYNGFEKPLSEWAKIFKIARTTLWARIYQQKWTLQEAFEMPIDTRGGGLKNKI